MPAVASYAIISRLNHLNTMIERGRESYDRNE